MKSVKLIVAYPQTTGASAFEKVYAQEHVPMAIANLHGKTKIVATKILPSPQGENPFYRVAEVHFASMEALQKCAESAGSKQPLANPVKISSERPPATMTRERA